ncbi:hypothetical protein KPH14_010178 [Odynerus spinipes]|uniref:Uncharacterized protein n=1 Tax=Odynerus spinipes TaxID=1348599 RepID=A0AAD9RTG4_9HYME|nr:hypothetical protein KPH14_010178 [Odynerus spinipes]
MPLKLSRFSVSNKITTDNKRYDLFASEKYAEKKEKSLEIGFKVADLLRNAIVCSLDLLLTIAVLPYIFYQWASKNERSVIILKAIIEIILEVIMWLIFAGVSILVTTAFIMEEHYFSKDDDKDFELLNDVSKDFDNIQFVKKKGQAECCSK